MFGQQQGGHPGGLTLLMFPSSSIDRLLPDQLWALHLPRRGPLLLHGPSATHRQDLQAVQGLGRVWPGGGVAWGPSRGGPPHASS